MINLPDTNQIAQAAQTVQAAAQAANTIKESISPWMITAIAGWATLAGRELNRATAASKNGAEWLLYHGGAGKLIRNLIWNSNNGETKSS